MKIRDVIEMLWEFELETEIDIMVVARVVTRNDALKIKEIKYEGGRAKMLIDDDY